MLAYGNPNRTYLPYLKKETILDSLLSELYSYTYPDNNSQEVIDEINQLIELTGSIEDNEEAKNRFKIYDENFQSYIISALANTGIPKEDIENLVKEIHDDITPLIVKLKYNFQRIRPVQLAYMLSMRLYPYQCKSVDSPSYPSGHTLQSKVYCEVLGNRYPKYYRQLQELAKDISDSRMYLGVHYSSDCEFAIYTADLILKHPEFKRKYRL
jgi:hypothetical protein